MVKKRKVYAAIISAVLALTQLPAVTMADVQEEPQSMEAVEFSSEDTENSEGGDFLTH